MSGIVDTIVAYGTSRLRSTFADDIGNQIVISGTGFWLAFDPQRPIFVTNKHNVDPTLNLGQSTKFHLHKFEIMLRRSPSPGVWVDEIRFFAIWQPTTCISMSDDADCAVLADFSWEHRDTNFQCGVITMKPEEIADQGFLASKMRMMDHVSFVGYPGSSLSNWWDTQRQLPIARSATIASLPQQTFSNPAIRTEDVTLVSGLSFSGSSGSPVFLLQKGIPLAGGGDHDGYAPPRLVGIMSGHFWDGPKTPEMFRHSGLSYYTRSTAIIALLKRQGLWPGP